MTREGMARNGMTWEGMAREGMAREGMALDGMAHDGLAWVGMAPGHECRVGFEENLDNSDGSHDYVPTATPPLLITRLQCMCYQCYSDKFVIPGLVKQHSSAIAAAIALLAQ